MRNWGEGRRDQKKAGEQKERRERDWLGWGGSGLCKPGWNPAQ